jgi:hypothetical protein
VSAKISGRPGREEQKQKCRMQRRALRQRQRAQGLEPPSRPAASNAICGMETVEEEQAARAMAVVEQVVIMRTLLPVLLRNLRGIEDPRQSAKVKHQLSALLLYGILLFVYQMASRREANRTMTRPQFLQNLKLLFPEVEELPHHDTLARVLARVDVEQIQEALIELLRTVLRRKKLRRFLMDGWLRIAVDGTQKLAREVCVNDHLLERTHSNGDSSQTEYYVYILEAAVVLGDGITLPLMSEFLSYNTDSSGGKQDCELRAFKRLAGRLKEAFPRQRIMLLIDGLYANGPVVTLCREAGWQYMIVLKDGSLPSLWAEAEGLIKLDPTSQQMNWRGRQQRYWWANGIEYTYDKGPRRPEILNVVVCQETWQDVDPKTGEIVTKRSRHAWISSQPVTPRNFHQRCNLCARHRWGIETCIQVEKGHGYSYEHCFAHDWKAMKGYHYLMRIAHFFNVLAQLSDKLAAMVRSMTMRGFFSFIRETVAGRWLTPEVVAARLRGCLQLRLE